MSQSSIVQSVKTTETPKGVLKVFSVIGQALLSMEDLEKTLQIIAQSAQETLGADIVDLYRYIESNDKFVLPLITAGKRQFPDFVPNQIRSDDIIAKAIHSAPQYFLNVRDVGFLTREFDTLRDGVTSERFVIREKIVSSAILPLVAADETIGIMCVNYRNPQTFNRDQQELIELFAHQAAIAIKNARLYDQRISDIRALSEINQAITSEQWTTGTELDRFLQIIVDKLVQILNAASCAVRLYSRQLDKFGQRFAAGRLRIEVDHRPRKNGSSYYLLHSESPKPLYVEDSSTQIPGSDRPVIREELQNLGVKSVAYLPLLSGDEAIGILYLEWARVHHFSTNEKQILELFAGQAVNAIKSTQLLQELGERARLLEQLQEVTAAISAEPRNVNVDGVLKSIATHIADIFMGASCEIRLYDSDKKEFTKRIAAGDLQEAVDYLPRTSGTTEYVISQDAPQPFYAESIDILLPDGTPAIRPRLRTLGIQAIATLPLMSKSRVIGVLYVDWKEVHHFSENDRRVLELFAYQAAIAIQNADRVDELFALGRIVQELSTGQSFSLKNMARILYQEARLMMDLDNFYVASYDEDECLVQFEFAAEEGEERAVGAEEYAPRVDGHGLTEYVLQNGNLVYIEFDVRKFRQKHDLLDGVSPTTPLPKSWLGVPIRVGDRVYGVIGVENREQPNAYDEFAQQVLRVAAAQIGVAIVRQQLAKRNTGMQILQEINAKISAALDLDETLPEIVKGALELMQLPKKENHSGVIHLIDESTLTIRRSYEYPEDSGHLPTRFTRREGLTWAVFDSKAPIEITNVPVNPDCSEGFRECGVKSVVGVPLKQGAGEAAVVIGVLFLNSMRTRDFTTDDKALLTLLAEQAAIAVQNATLVKALQQYSTRLEYLQDISTEIVTKPFSLTELLRTIVDNLSVLFAGTPCSVRLYDSKKNRFLQRVGTRLVEQVLPPRAKGTSRYLLETKEPLYIEDTLAPPAGVPNVHQNTLDRGVRAVAYLPLLTENDLVGVLHVNMETTYHFSNSEKRILNLFANQAAVAIENAQLYEQLTRRNADLDLLRRVSTRINATVKIEESLELIMKGAIELTTADSGIIHLIDPDLPAVKNSYEDSGKYRHISPRFAERIGLTWMAFSTKEIVEVVDVPDSEEVSESFRNSGVRSVIGVPMQQAGQVIGVLFLNRLESRAFTDEEKDLLRLLAEQAAIAVQKADLIDTLEVRVAERTQDLSRANASLESLHDIGVTVTSHLDLQDVLGEIADNAHELIGADFATIFTYNRKSDTYNIGIRKGAITDLPILPTKNGYTAQLIRERSAIFVGNVQKSKPDANLGFVKDKTISAFAGIPLLFGDEPVGVLFINFFESHPFSDQEKNVLRLLASDAAVAIQNARLYAELEKANKDLEARVAERTRDLEKALEETEILNQLGDELAIL